MAKAKKEAAAQAVEEKKKPTPPVIEKPEYGIDQLAELTGIEDRSALRTKLRGIDGLQDQYKPGRAWDFGTKKNLEAVAKQIKGDAKAKPAADSKKK